MADERIEWIGGYPHVIGVNDPQPTPQEQLSAQILEDILWEATTPLKGWAKVQAFINRVLGGESGHRAG